MAWYDSIVPMVRVLVNDVDEETYTSFRLQKVGLVAASYVVSQIPFDNNYVVNIVASSISPNPETTSPKDYTFINLVSLKSAVLITSSELKTKTRQQISVKDGPSTIELKEVGESLTAQAEAVLDAYNFAVTNYLAGNSIGGCAVTTPTAVFIEPPRFI